MRSLLQCNIPCCIRMVLIVVGFHFLADCSCAQHEIFRASVIQKWKDYETFSRNLQGTARWTDTTPARKGRTTLKHYKQNQECALSIFPGNPGDDTNMEFCELTNPHYIARIKRSRTDPNDVILDQYVPLTISEAGTNDRSTLDAVFAATSPHFQHADSPLSQLVVIPSFKVLKTAKEPHNGQELIRVDYTYIYDVPGRNKAYQRRIRGSLFFDPSRCWCLRKFKDSREGIFRGELSYKAELEYEYEVIDHPSGFPIIKKRTEHVVNFFYKNKRKIDATSKTDYDLEVREGPPNSEFTLTAFGLPEPGGEEPVTKPIPIYVWLLIAAGVCGAIAFAFRYLARRRRLTTAA